METDWIRLFAENKMAPPEMDGEGEVGDVDDVREPNSVESSHLKGQLYHRQRPNLDLPLPNHHWVLVFDAQGG